MDAALFCFPSEIKRYFLFPYLWENAFSLCYYAWWERSTKGYVKVCNSFEQTIIKLSVSSISVIGF